MLFISPESFPSQNKHIFGKKVVLIFGNVPYLERDNLLFFQKRPFEKIKFLLLKFIHLINIRVIGIEYDRNFQPLPKFVHKLKLKFE